MIAGCSAGEVSVLEIRWVTLCLLPGVRGQGAGGYGTAGGRQRPGLLWTCPASRRSRDVVELHVVPFSSRCHSDRCIAVINTLSDFFSHPRFLILSLLPPVCLCLHVSVSTVWLSPAGQWQSVQPCWFFHRLSLLISALRLDWSTGTLHKHTRDNECQYGSV